MEKRVRSVHAYVVGTLNAYDFELDRNGKTPIYYQPYLTETFVNERTRETIFNASVVVVSYDRAFITTSEEAAEQMLLTV